MAWTPLASRLSTAPLVIAGPILRRTTAQSVSVWICCKEPVTDLQLSVYEDIAPTPSTILHSVSTSTMAFGDHIHIAVITADTPSNPGIFLLPDHIYRYNISFGGTADLTTQGILSPPGSGSGGIDKITYGTLGLPSFILPASDRNSLKLVHASCRKPHGGKTDALRALDVILDSTHNDPSLRPQFMCLTGDQIYADDVDDGLLFMLMDAAGSLLGWDETLPGTVTPQDLVPGNRQELINNNHLTSGEAKSHLIKLGEYYSMYLFVWSPELWPADLPEYNDVWPGRATHFPTPSSWQSRAHNQLPDEFPTEAYGRYGAERVQLQRFADSLRFVRKAMANIPIYMMFDDHEITDDWFLNRKWCQDALGGDLSRRIIQNGMAAFAIFQGWANIPDDFRTGNPGATILQQLRDLHSHQGAQAADWTQIGNTILPAVVSAGGGNHKLDNGFRWNFTIDFPAFRLTLLDSRTRRGFASLEGPPTLVNGADLPVQIPTPPTGQELCILIAPAPVTGHYLVEEIIQPAGRAILGLFNTTSGAAAVDYEAWSLNRWGFEALLERLVPLQRVLILSGDVHYAFSNSIQYWDDRSSTTRRAAFAQLCASSLKNETSMTNTLARRFLGPRMSAEYLGWNNPGSHIRMQIGGMAVGDRYVSGHPAIHRLQPDEHPAPGHTPEWRYRIIFDKDNRPEAARGIPAPVSIPTQSQQRAAYHHRRRSDWDAQRVIVGKDNLGVATFSWATQQTVQHELWYVPIGQREFEVLLLPYTRHTVQLTIPTSATPIPGGP